MGWMVIPPSDGGGGTTSGASRIRGRSITGSASASSASGGGVQKRGNSRIFAVAGLRAVCCCEKSSARLKVARGSCVLTRGKRPGISDSPTEAALSAKKHSGKTTRIGRNWRSQRSWRLVPRNAGAARDSGAGAACVWLDNDSALQPALAAKRESLLPKSRRDCQGSQQAEGPLRPLRLVTVLRRLLRIGEHHRPTSELRRRNLLQTCSGKCHHKADKA